MRLGELAGYIQETMESYEVEVNGKVLPGASYSGRRFWHPLTPSSLPIVKPIENLSGHSINPYQIHGGKSVLLVKNDDATKMEEGEYFAIETFGSTGRGKVIEQGECSHYARKVDAPHVPLRYDPAKLYESYLLMIDYAQIDIGQVTIEVDQQKLRNPSMV